MRITRSARDIAARNTARKSVPIVRDDALGPQLDAEVAEPAGQEKRVGVEPRRAEKLGSDGDDFRGREWRSILRDPCRNAATSITRSDMFAYTAAIASSAITPRPPCSCSKRPAGYGLITSNTRNSKKPASAPDQPTGMNARVMSMPTTSSITTGPGSMPPKYCSAVVPAQTPSANSPAMSADFDDRRMRPPDEQIDDQTGRRADCAGREWEVAAVRDRGDEHGEASHALTTRVSARRSWIARLSAPMSAGSKPSPAGSADTGVRRRPQHRMAERHARGAVIDRDDLVSRSHLADRLSARRGEEREVAAGNQQKKGDEWHRGNRIRFESGSPQIFKVRYRTIDPMVEQQNVIDQRGDQSGAKRRGLWTRFGTRLTGSRGDHIAGGAGGDGGSSCRDRAPVPR